MTAEEFLSLFERRDFWVLYKNGGLRVEPFAKLTPADRAAIAEVAADRDAKSTLVRLLRERESAIAELSPTLPAGFAW